MEGPLVGREHELARLCAWLDEAAGPRPEARLVLVSGEPGIGKTRLVLAAAASTDDRRPVAIGHTTEQDGAPPFWPWRQILGRLDGPDLFERDRSDDPEAERFRRFEEVTAWFAGAARAAGGAVIVLEDAHRADAASLRLLGHVAARLDDEPLALVVTHRSGTADQSPAFATTLDTLRRLPACRRLELTGLAPDAVAVLLGNADASLAQRITERTNGNALYVLEVARHFDAGGDERTVPASVRDLVAHRLAQRSAACADAMRVGAVLGREFAVGLVATVLDHPALSVLASMDEATAGGLVRPAAIPGRYRFVHALVRDAVEATIDAATLPVLHRRIALAIETYEGTGDLHLADLARHWDGSAVLGARDVAASWCERAAHAAERRLAWEEAARLYDRSVSLGSATAGPVDRHRRLLGAARTSLLVDDLAVAVDRCVLAAEAAQAARRPDLLAAAALVVEARAGPAIHALLPITEAALHATPADDHAHRARLFGQLAALCFYLDPPRCGPLSTAAMAEADRTDDPMATVAATRARQMAITVPSGADERLALAKRIGRAGRALRQPSVAMWEPIWRIDALMELGRVPEATAALGELRRRCDEAGVPIAQWQHARLEATMAQATGRFADADDAGRRARALFAALEDPVGAQAMYLGLRCSIGWHVGFGPETADAWDHVDLASAPPFLGDLPNIGPVVAYVGADRLDRARALYARVAPVESWQPPPFLTVALTAMRLQAALSLGRIDELPALIAALEPWRGRHAAASGGSITYTGCVELHLGQAAAALGHWDLAVTDLRAAVAIARAAATPNFAVEAAVVLVESLRARGAPEDRVEADAADAEWRPVGTRLGMVPWIARLDAATPDGKAAANDRAGTTAPAILSARELEVAALVARGETNKAIAVALFISERTAQNHVQHILTKLGVSNRTQIAAWFHERRAIG